MPVTGPPLSCDLGGLTRCDGSAQFSCGSTVMLAGVLGPGEVKGANNELIDRASVQVSVHTLVGSGSVQDKAREEFLRQLTTSALLTTLHPRTRVHVSLQPLDGDVTPSAGVNAACLALLDAAVEMRYLFAAVTIGVTGDGGLVLEPSSSQSCLAKMTFVFDSVAQDILASQLEGKCSEKKFQECLAAGREASLRVFEFYREMVRKKFSKELL